MTSDGPPTIPIPDLPQRLALARTKKLGINQAEMGRRLGIHQKTVSNYETGSIEPKLVMIRAWAIETNVPLDWLVSGPDHRCDDCRGAGH